MNQEISKPALLAAICLAIMTVLSCQMTLPRAAMTDDIPLIEKRLELGDNINMYDRYGWTPLMWAVYYNQQDAVKHLLSRGANPNLPARDDYGSFYRGATPLMICAMYDYKVLADMLIVSGVNLTARDRRGNSAVDIAEQNNLLEMMNLLTHAIKQRKEPLAPEQ